MNSGDDMKEFKTLTIQNLYKSFGSTEVLNDFNLTIEKGEFVTFLGPSGCGKSTALNCICGLIPMSSGEIYIDGECLDNSVDISTAPEKRGFGMVFQNYALFPHLTIAKNISFGLELKKMDKKEIKQRVENVLELVHLEGHGDKYPSQLSGGQQQRVAIARCIVLEPRLLMLDEPLSNLDAKLRLEMRYELKSLHERLQITTIYVTHDQHEALALSDKIVVMKLGRIQQVGNAQEVYAKPVNLFTADFMGYKNMWEGKIVRFVESGDGVEMILDVNGISVVSKLSFTKNDAVRKINLKTAYETGKTVLTAIRPEDITAGEGTVNCFECRISLTEYLGKVSNISADMQNGVKIDARPECDTFTGNTIKLYVPPEKILVFLKEEG
jgi:putative spermidine/putrescine transport system ATP-binding protein